MAQQVCLDGWKTRRIGKQRPGWLRPNEPPRRSDARARLHRATHHKNRKAGLSGSQRQSPARRQIDELGGAPYPDHHGSQRRAARGLFTRAQNSFHVIHPHQHEAGRIKPQSTQAVRIQAARFNLQDVLPDKDDRTLTGSPGSKTQTESGSCRAVGLRCRINLMQPNPRQTTAQRPVDRFGAQSNPLLGHLGERDHFESRRHHPTTPQNTPFVLVLFLKRKLSSDNVTSVVCK